MGCSDSSSRCKGGTYFTFNTAGLTNTGGQLDMKRGVYQMSKIQFSVVNFVTKRGLIWSAPLYQTQNVQYMKSNKSHKRNKQTCAIANCLNIYTMKSKWPGTMWEGTKWNTASFQLKKNDWKSVVHKDYILYYVCCRQVTCFIVMSQKEFSEVFDLITALKMWSLTKKMNNLNKI